MICFYPAFIETEPSRIWVKSFSGVVLHLDSIVVAIVHLHQLGVAQH